MIIIKKNPEIEFDVKTIANSDDLTVFLNENKDKLFNGVWVGLEIKFRPNIEKEKEYNPFTPSSMNVEDFDALEDIIEVGLKQQKEEDNYLENLAFKASQKASTSEVDSIALAITIDLKTKYKLLIKATEEFDILHLFVELLEAINPRRLYTCHRNNITQFLQRCIVLDFYQRFDIIRRLIKAKSDLNLITKEDTVPLPVIDIMDIWSFYDEANADRIAVILNVFGVKEYHLGLKYAKCEKTETPSFDHDLLDISQEDLLTLSDEDYMWYIDYKLHVMCILVFKFFGREFHEAIKDKERQKK